MTSHQAWNDLLSALGLLSRLPLPHHTSRGAEAAWAYPLAGAILGTLSGAIGLLALWIGLPAEAAAILVIVCAVMTTGALHQDGLADLADGFWGGQDISRRLDIMKDSRIGAYGVIALILCLLAQWIALTGILSAPRGWAAIICAATLSRSVMPVMMCLLPNARQSGLSRALGPVALLTAAAAMGIGIGASIVCVGLGKGILSVILAALVIVIMSRLALRKIGGQTGDVLGASQQIAEIAILFGLLAG